MQSRVHCVIKSGPSIARRLPTSHHYYAYAYTLHHYNNYKHSYKHNSRTITTTPKMSDSNYLSFLEKANADHTGQTQTASQSQSQSQNLTKTLDTNAQIPTSLTSIDAFYTSDTDEPFEPVVLRWDGGVLPDSGTSLPFFPSVLPLGCSVQGGKLMDNGQNNYHL